MKLFNNLKLISTKRLIQICRYWSKRLYNGFSRVVNFFSKSIKRTYCFCKTHLSTQYEKRISKPVVLVIYHFNDIKAEEHLKDFITFHEKITCASSNDKNEIDKAIKNKKMTTIILINCTADDVSLPNKTSVHYIATSKLISDSVALDCTENTSFKAAYETLGQQLLLTILFSGNNKTAEQWRQYYTEQLSTLNNTSISIKSISICACSSIDKKPLQQTIIKLSKASSEISLEKTEKRKRVYLVILTIFIGILCITSITTLYQNHKLNQQATDLITTIQQSENNDQYNNISDMIDFIRLSSNKSNLLGLRIDRKIASKLSHYVYQQLSLLFAKPVAQLLSQQLAQDTNYTTLEDYLLLYAIAYPIDENTKKTYAQLWQAWLWKTSRFDINPNKLINFYADYRQHYQPKNQLTSMNKQLIRRVRQQLGTNSINHSLYQRYQQQQLKQNSNLSLSQWLKDTDTTLKNIKGLSMFYSYHYWQTRVKNDLHQLAIQASKGNWVLKQSPGSMLSSRLQYHNSSKPTKQRIQHLEQQFNELYFQQQIAAWLNFLGAIKLSSSSTPSEQYSMLSKLIKNKEYERVLTLIKQNTNYIIKQSHDKNLIQQVRQINSDVSLVGKNIFENYQQSLQALSNNLATLSQSPRASELSQGYAKEILLNNADNNVLYKASVAANLLTLDMRESTIKKHFSHFFQLPVNSSWQLLLNTSYQCLQQQWRNQVLQYYSRYLQSYFPFANHQQDAEVENVIHFFQPQKGLYAKFVQNNIVGFMHKTAGHWQLNKWHGKAIPVTKDFIKQLNKMEIMSQLLFSNTQQLSFHMSFMPLASPYVQMIKLNVNQRTMTYYNGPAHWYYFKWHDDLEGNTSSLDIINANRQLYSKQYQGPWSLLRLLSHRHSLSQQGTHCKLTWLIHKTQISMLLKSPWCRSKLLRKGK